MRKACYDCTRKHLAQALVISHELAHYAGDLDDDHLWVCVGHLAEAEAQIQKKQPYISDLIREQRLMLMKEGASSACKLSLNTMIQLVCEAAEADKAPSILGVEPSDDE